MAQDRLMNEPKITAELVATLAWPDGHAYVCGPNGFVETADFRNATRAFLEKRKPQWQGR